MRRFYFIALFLSAAAGIVSSTALTTGYLSVAYFGNWYELCDSDSED